MPAFRDCRGDDQRLYDVRHLESLGSHGAEAEMTGLIGPNSSLEVISGWNVGSSVVCKRCIVKRSKNNLHLDSRTDYRERDTFLFVD